MAVSKMKAGKKPTREDYIKACTECIKINVRLMKSLERVWARTNKQNEQFIFIKTKMEALKPTDKLIGLVKKFKQVYEQDVQ